MNNAQNIFLYSLASSTLLLAPISAFATPVNSVDFSEWHHTINPVPLTGKEVGVDHYVLEDTVGREQFALEGLVSSTGLKAYAEGYFEGFNDHTSKHNWTSKVSSEMNTLEFSGPGEYVLTSMNISLTGQLNFESGGDMSTSSPVHTFSTGVFINSTPWISFNQTNFQDQIDAGIINYNPLTGVYRVDITTPDYYLKTDTTYYFNWSLMTSAGGITLDDHWFKTTNNVMNTLAFNPDLTPFNLQPGFTVNSSDLSIVNNQVIAAAVPEPSTYAMMLGGLGLVGLMAARRRKA